jgi:hypothetical protein
MRGLVPFSLDIPVQTELDHLVFVTVLSILGLVFIYLKVCCMCHCLPHAEDEELRLTCFLTPEFNFEVQEESIR